jgi:hypothetical protein
MLVGAIAVLALLYLAHRLGWIDLSDKSRRGGSRTGGVMLIGDEVFAPAKYEAQVEADRQARLPVPAPIPGEGVGDVYGDGPVRIALDADGNPVL